MSVQPPQALGLPLRIGIAGTGYAAKIRAEALQADPRSHLVAVVGHTPEKTESFSQTFQMEVVATWQDLVQRDDLDLIIIATINRDHGSIAQAALQAGKHVVMEYPLALTVTEAEALLTLAQTQQRLLHVEHIEMLSGIHPAIRDSLDRVGTPFYVRYATISPQRPVADRWSYQPNLFGFPLIGALSRVQRLIDLFGTVATVNCQTRYWSHEGFSLPTWAGLSSGYAACLCNAQLQFSSGLLADLSYGKGETFWQASRILEIQAERGALVFDGDEGRLIQGGEPEQIATAGRRGLFAKDTTMVLDHLTNDSPLYIQPSASLYALKVADAARRSAETGQPIKL